MKIRIIIYFLLLLSLPVQLHAQTKRALVIGLGEQQDRAWKKINGDKDVPFVQAMLVSVSAMQPFFLSLCLLPLLQHY